MTSELNTMKKLLNIFKTRTFLNYFCILILILVLTSTILKLDCTYHTFDHATSRDKVSRRLNSIKMQNLY